MFEVAEPAADAVPLITELQLLRNALGEVVAAAPEIALQGAGMVMVPAACAV